MPVTVTNLIQGPAVMYAGVFGAVEPATISAAPATGWTDVGGTQDGVSLNVELTLSELNVDQIIDIPGQRVTKRVAKVVTNLAEATLNNWALALNELAATITANKFTPTLNLVPFNPPYAALLFDGVAPGGFKRRVIVRKCLQIGNPSSAAKKDAQTLIPVEFASHFVSASVAPFSIEDATS